MRNEAVDSNPKKEYVSLRLRIDSWKPYLSAQIIAHHQTTSSDNIITHRHQRPRFHFLRQIGRKTARTRKIERAAIPSIDSFDEASR